MHARRRILQGTSTTFRPKLLLNGLKLLWLPIWTCTPRLTSSTVPRTFRSFKKAEPSAPSRRLRWLKTADSFDTTEVRPLPLFWDAFSSHQHPNTDSAALVRVVRISRSDTMKGAPIQQMFQQVVTLVFIVCRPWCPIPGGAAVRDQPTSNPRNGPFRPTSAGVRVQGLGMRRLPERTPFMATCFVKTLFHNKNALQKRYVCAKIRTCAVPTEHIALACCATWHSFDLTARASQI